MTTPLTSGAAWLAKVVAYPRRTPRRSPWPPDGKPVPIPIGPLFHVVRVPAGSAARAIGYLEARSIATGPVLSQPHVWSFLVPTSLVDGRDIPGGVLLTGRDRTEALMCPQPGRPASKDRYWKAAPDGSGRLMDPPALAEAIANTFAVGDIGSEPGHLAPHEGAAHG
ncbi:hypothetical protein BX286_6301 [Streptomyces sp. 3211.6]|uniref:hypothetical protein n=1 Tax=Streptomyces sp. 3211.6 TaxID=1938845 RepID=UPI000EAD3602|nr:hypothetical protein [Streptomyces sp. 3211.6]RKT08217.1 hypothetical protein BX286_6301 [Streptomyces sp. 3211.6]